MKWHRITRGHAPVCGVKAHYETTDLVVVNFKDLHDLQIDIVRSPCVAVIGGAVYIKTALDLTNVEKVYLDIYHDFKVGNEEALMDSIIARYSDENTQATWFKLKMSGIRNVPNGIVEHRGTRRREWIS